MSEPNEIDACREAFWSRVREIEARHEAATAGPWKWKTGTRGQSYLGRADNADPDEFAFPISDDGSACSEYNQVIEPDSPNGIFIEHSWGDVAWLLEKLQEFAGDGI